jgi:arginine decarboxylase
VVTNSTYDGLCYNAELIKQQWGQRRGAALRRGLVRLCGVPRVLRRALRHGHCRAADSPLVFTTHSTHKLLAAFSQASMIHVQDGGARNWTATASTKRS